MLNHTRRLTPEEIQERLPKILASHERKTEKRIDARIASQTVQRVSAVKIGVSLDNKFRRAVANGTRFRAKNGRFLGLPKAA
jgi:hypothetical protein